MRLSVARFVPKGRSPLQHRDLAIPASRQKTVQPLRPLSLRGNQTDIELHMRTYRRITIETVQRDGRMVWRVVGWVSAQEWSTVVHCPNEEMAQQIKLALTETVSGDTRRYTGR